MRNLALVMTVLLTLLLSAGCSGQYATSEASEQERNEIERSVKAYVSEAAQKAAQKTAGVPKWLAGVEDVRLVGVEKMKTGYKALVQLRGKASRTCYFLLEKRDGEYRVTGIL